MSRLLWFIPSPRNFSLFWSWVDKVDFVDKLIVKNHVHHVAIKIGMDYFKEHEEYTHLLLSSDDVLGTPDYVNMLIRDEEEHGFPVVTGWNNTAHRDNYSNITVERVKVVDKNLNKTTETFRPSKVYPYLSVVDVAAGKYGYPFIKAWYVGFPLALFQRKTLMEVPFRPFLLQKDGLCNTPETAAKGRGTGYDLQFCIDCQKKKIPIRVDTRVLLLHFGKTKALLNIGREEASVRLVAAGGRKVEIQVPEPVMPLMPTPRLKLVNPVVRKWSDHIEFNKSLAMPWHTGLPYGWWRGMGSRAFLEKLPEHLEKEDKW
jgi:hypothetical protein